jgi:Ni,Fe-hydrogenase III small subunit
MHTVCNKKNINIHAYSFKLYSCMLIFILLQAEYMYVDILLITSCIHVCWYLAIRRISTYMHTAGNKKNINIPVGTCIQLAIRRISTYMYTACNKKNINIHVCDILLIASCIHVPTGMLIFFLLPAVCMYVDILLITSCIHVCWYSSYYKLYACMLILTYMYTACNTKNINIHE